MENSFENFQIKVNNHPCLTNEGHKYYTSQQEWVSFLDKEIKNWKVIVMNNFELICNLSVDRGDSLYDILLNIHREKFAVNWITNPIIKDHKHHAISWLHSYADKNIWNNLTYDIKKEFVLDLYQYPGFPISEIKNIINGIRHDRENNDQIFSNIIAQLGRFGFVPNKGLTKLRNIAEECSDNEFLTFIDKIINDYKSSINKYVESV